MRLAADLLADKNITLGPGDAAEFDTYTPHWLGAAGDVPAEVLLLSGGPGDRIRLKTRQALQKTDRRAGLSPDERRP